MLQTTLVEVKNYINYDEIYCNDDVYFDNFIFLLIEKGMNEVKIDYDSNCNYNNNSEEKILDNLNDNGYNRYDRYNE